jgi:citrate synthase
MLSADEAAQRLGVKVETVYAYVSRGSLTSHRGPDGRRSTFDAAEVDALARRGRPRRTTRPPALDFTIESRLTRIHDHRLSFRGHDALELARTRTFEQVAELLWTGTVPERPPIWQPVADTEPAAFEPTAGMLDQMDRIRLATVLTAAADPLRGDLRPASVTATARTLLSTAVHALPLAPGADAATTPRLTLPDGGTPIQGTLAGHLWTRLGPSRPRGLLPTLNAALALLADHELASSTLAARVAASTRADPYAVVLAGLGPLAGPLHGGASRAVRRLLESAEQVGATTALAEAARAHGSWPGFGHPLYPKGDPRARALLDELRRAVRSRRGMGPVESVLAAAQQRAEVAPNVDFALGALGHVAGMAPESGEVIFTVARMAGWVAHAIEEYGEAPLRFRARAVPRPRGEP